MIREIHALQTPSSSSSSSSRENSEEKKKKGIGIGAYFSTATAPTTAMNDFQTILRLHKKFLANLLQLSMMDAQGIQEMIDRILHLCLRFIACCRIQANASTAADGAENLDSYLSLPSEEFEQIQRDFYQQIAFLFQSMKTSDRRGFLFRLDFNNFLSNQILALQQQQLQHLPPPLSLSAMSSLSGHPQAKGSGWSAQIR